MLQQFFHNTPENKKYSPKDILYDIDFFYSSLQQTPGLIDNRFFEKIFRAPYWKFLKHFDELDKEELDYLHQGVMGILLFMGYQYLFDKGDQIAKAHKEITGSLYRFSSDNGKTEKLKDLVLETLKMVALKKAGQLDVNRNNEIYKSITWTLKNIVLNNKIKSKGRSFDLSGTGR